MIEMAKKTIYIAKKSGYITDTTGNEIPTYSEPVAYRANVQPLSGYMDIQSYGEKIDKMYKAVLNSNEFVDVFNEGDKAYLGGITPDGETVNGENANYLVVSVRTQFRIIQVYFEKIQKGE